MNVSVVRISKIAGTGQSFHEGEHCLAAIRIIPYIIAIVRNNPQLKRHFVHREDIGSFLAGRLKQINPGNVPFACGIGWYRPDTYARCLAIFEDASDLPDTFADWLRIAEQTERHLRREGMDVVRVEIDPNTFPAWCADNGITRVNRHARMQYGNTKALEYLQSKPDEM